MLESYSDEMLEMELERRKSAKNSLSKCLGNPIGVWEVVTDGYPVAKALGVYSGHVADIAMYLAHNSEKTLFFKRLNVQEVHEPSESTGVEIHIQSELKLLRYSVEDRSSIIEGFLKSQPSLNPYEFHDCVIKRS